MKFQEKVSKLPGFGPKQVNHCIKKNESKVVDTIDIEDMGDKVSFSKKNVIFQILQYSKSY